MTVPVTVRELEPAVRDYLDRHGWPTYISARTIIDTEPEILTGWGHYSLMQNRRFISLCLRELGYVKYTTTYPTLRLQEVAA